MFDCLGKHDVPQDEVAASEGENRQVAKGVQPVEDSLAILWDVVSALHDSGWHEDDLPQAILRLWKVSTIEPRLSNLSSLSLPEDFVAADTIPVELTSLGPCEIATSPGVDVGTTRYGYTCCVDILFFPRMFAFGTTYHSTLLDPARVVYALGVVMYSRAMFFLRPVPQIAWIGATLWVSWENGTYSMKTMALDQRRAAQSSSQRKRSVLHDSNWGRHVSNVPFWIHRGSCHNSEFLCEDPVVKTKLWGVVLGD